MQPCEVAVRAFELVELRLLAEPEDAERQQAEQPGQKPRRGGRECVEEFGLGVNVRWLRRVKVEHQNGRRDGEETVAERRYAADLAAGQSVVVRLHAATIAFRRRLVNPSGDAVIAAGNASLPSAV
jgi:hypothetical protein